MTTRCALLIALATLALPGCKERTPYAQDLELICDAPKKVPKKLGTKTDAEAFMAQYINENLQTLEARDLLRSMAHMPAALRANALESEALGVGIRKCPMAERLR